MRNSRWIWIPGLLVTLAILVIPIALLWPRSTSAADDANAHLPTRKPHTDHTALLGGPFDSGPEVTETCLGCHPQAADQIMATTHWTWESKPYEIARRDEPVTVGKKNSLNNFCIGIKSNWEGCTSCHAGYGWESAEFDFSVETNVDCLVCHDQSGTYVKGNAGWPVEGVDLAEVAQSVGYPTRENCGICHADGGGGNGVKHGDIDEHLYFPSTELDVHMGGQEMECIDCHQTRDHQIRGRSISVGLDVENQVACTDCHDQDLHTDSRINAHTDTVACQTCHITEYARQDPTKMFWDWSTAGHDWPEDPHEYLKIKGSFVYQENVIPEYRWYSGVADRYLMGDVIDLSQPTRINTLLGDINDPQAVIFPFKIHVALQPYDRVYNYLLQPKTVGEGGFWTEFNWQQAFRLGMETVGLPYSGEYGFTETHMYWPISHTVQPAGEALVCAACHGENGRLDWIALGYLGDPMKWGGRQATEPLR
jgi:octaheme c-type cytochrome (tetrathionate reductase family)